MTVNDKPKRPGSKPVSRDKQTKPGPSRGDDKPKKTAPVRATADAEGGDKAERISKVMARAGVASRRDIERMIMEGRVRLNGVLLDTPVVNVTLTDKIEVDGMPIRGIERTRLWLYHKPAGLVTTNSDPEGRSTVFDNLPEDLPRVMSIGRLDINTEGLLLLTNDGGLARVLELPTTGWLRRYRVRAHGEIDQDALDKLKEGIAVDGVLYGSIEATLDRTQGSNVWITMGLREGKNREIKNVLGALGLDVNRLIRISYGPFQLGELPEGNVIEVRGRTLRDQLGPRLVEDAKANFDAPIYNAPAVTSPDEEEDETPQRSAPKGDRVKADRAKDEQRSSGERPRDVRPRREKPGEKRERALSRLDTKRDDSRDDDRPKRPPLGSRRNANVWMAPGARPLGEKAALKAAKNARTDAKRGGDRDRERPQRGGFAAAPASVSRVQVNRVREEDGEWIRSSEDGPGKSRDDEGGFGRKRSFGDRPDRGDRPPRSDRPDRGDRPARGERSFSDRPSRGDKPRGDKPFGDRPRGDRRPRAEGDERPRGERSFAGRPPRGDKPFGDKPFGDKPRGDRRPRAEGAERPRGERSFGDPARGDKPFGSKSHGDRPRGNRGPRPDGAERPRAKSFDGEQRSERTGGERSFGDRPAGGKPAGKSFGGKPGGKSFGGKPGGKPGAKSFSGKPRGDGAGGGRPSGGPGRGGPRGKRG
jgi:23S rRNA pseudouridine2605 synthase